MARQYRTVRVLAPFVASDVCLPPRCRVGYVACMDNDLSSRPRPEDTGEALRHIAPAATVAVDATRGRDALGDRMKAYEMATRTVLPRRSWSLIRLDGRTFHSWTRGLGRPYSVRLLDAMGEVTREMCAQVPGVVCALQQSDELTLVTHDFARPETEPWFGGQVQKIASVSASMMTALFARQFPDRAPAMFDARVFTVPNRIEVANALYWRYIDGTRNAINAIASAHFSPRRLHGVSTTDRVQMCLDAGVNLDAVDARFRYGQFARQTTRLRTHYVDRRTGATIALDPPALSAVWEVAPAPALHAGPDGVLLAELLPPDPDD